jgi:hypothetical protein
VIPKLVMLEGDRPALAPDVETEVYADACRSAGLAFLEGARGGWGKRQLAEWLVGPYQAVALRLAGKGGDAGRGHIATPVTESAVQELVDLVRIAVGSAISELRRGDTSCVTLAIRDQTLASAHDARGVVWIPADRPRIRLEARVLSLFLADYLLRSEPYERGDVTVCSDCDSVSFDGADRSCAVCNDRSHDSHVRGTSRAPGILKAPKTAG